MDENTPRKLNVGISKKLGFLIMAFSELLVTSKANLMVRYCSRIWTPSTTTFATRLPLATRRSRKNKLVTERLPPLHAPGEAHRCGFSMPFNLGMRRFDTPTGGPSQITF